MGKQRGQLLLWLSQVMFPEKKLEIRLERTLGVNHGNGKRVHKMKITGRDTEMNTSKS